MSANLTNLISGLFGVGAETFLLNDAIQSAEQSGEDALITAQNAADDITSASGFQPYSVTSGNGAVDALATDGRFSGLNLNLSPEQAEMVSLLQGKSVNALNAADFDVADRAAGLFDAIGLADNPVRSEQDIFDLLQEVGAGERERERLALETRLFSQGRSGVRTAEFGGTPEQLALAKAQEEQRGRTAVDAFNLARQEEDRRFSQGATLLDLARREKEVNSAIGTSLFNTSFLPMDDLRRTATLGADIGSIDQQARTEGLRTGGALVEGGLQANIRANETANAARIQRNQQLADLLLGTTNEEGVNAGGLFDQILDLF